MIENHDLGADLLHLRKQVSAQHDRCVAALGDAANNLQNLGLTGRVKAESRLVEEHHDGVVDQGAGDSEPLPHTAAVARDQ